MSNKKTVVLGMSGGVDSSVALYFLKEQGFEVLGVSLKFGFWENPKGGLKENVCCSKIAIERAKKVCQKYGVPHFVVDASKEFRKKVIDYFLKTLQENKTPSPCVFCNRDVKLSALLRFAKEKGADYIATGHYARKKKVGEKFQLLRARDKEKDQTYFLSLLNQKQLSKLILLLGDYNKQEVYEIARKEGIEFTVKESQDLCFVSDKSLPNFLEEEIGVKPGKIQNTKGDVLGEHQGLHFYTRGQRKGIKLANGPFWVVSFDEKNNVLIVTNDSDDLKLFSKQAILSDVNFISGKSPEKPIEVEAKIRFRQSLAKALLSSGSPTSTSWKLVFDEPQRAITSGQIAVFYQGAICLGGGVIQ